MEETKTERILLAMPAQMLTAIDAARTGTLRKENRTAWILRTIEEQLIRDGAILPQLSNVQSQAVEQ